MKQERTTAIKRYFRNADMFLLGAALLVCTIGLVLIYSATHSYQTSKFVIVQCGGILLGVIAFVVLSVFDLERLARFWPVIFVFNLLFQISLQFFGSGGEEVGNNSWINLGIINIQPGEIGKLLFIITFARHIYALKDRLNSPLSVGMLLMHAVLITSAVFYFSKDLGVAIMYIAIMFTMLFASGMSTLWVGGLFAGVCGAFPLLWRFVFGDYQKLRILVVFEPEISEKYAYQAKQSMLAIGSGRLFGNGFLQGLQTQRSRIPAKHTDFIFAVCGEEFGFIGIVVLLTLLTVIIVRVFYNSTRTDDLFNRLLCVGVGSMIMVQVLINVGMCMGIMPVVGLTLPFVSYGGTSVLTMLASLGVVSGCLLRRKPSWLRNRDE